MKVRFLLIATTLCTLVSSPTFAEDGSATASTPSFEVQAQLELLTMGSTTYYPPAEPAFTRDLAVAYAISGMFEYALTPYLSVGAAPRLIFHVITTDAPPSQRSDKELDVRARIRVHHAISGLKLYAAVTPGYTFMLSGDNGGDTWKGFAIGGSVGVSYDLSSRMFLGAEVGYQRAFTKNDMMLGNVTIPDNWDLSYLHVGLGAGTRF